MRKTIAVLSSVATLFCASLAFAGAKNPTAVVINTVKRIANGGVGGARNSSNAVEWIGCQYEATTTTAFVTCTATTAAGVSASCTSNAAKIVAAVTGLTGDAYLQFTYDATGKCTDIVVWNASLFEPKQL